MLRWMTGLVVLLFAALASGAPPVLVLNSTDRATVTEKSTEFLEDKQGSLTFENVRALGDDNFQPQTSLQTLTDGSVYWLRVRLKSGFPNDTMLILSGAWWDFIDGYVVHADGNVETLRQAGLRGRPKSANEGMYATFMLQREQEVLLYVRLESTGQFRKPDNARLTLRPQLPLLERSQYSLYLDGIIFGILFGLAVYNGLLAMSTRDKSYYWYCIYLLFIAISFMGQMGNQAPKITQFFFPDSPLIGIWLKRMSDPIGYVSLIMFTRLFLESKSALPRWDKLLLILMLLQVVQFVHFAFFGAAAALGLVIYLTVNIVCIIVGYLRLQQGYVAARYFIAAQCLLLLTGLPGTAYLLGWDMLTFLPADGFVGYLRANRIVFVGFALEAMLFSLALAQRMRALQDKVASNLLAFEVERKRIAEEQKQHLEREVAERTRELSQEKAKSDQLLYNILPAVAADELKATGASEPRRHEEVTILFTDFKGFTNTVSTLPPRKVVEELNDIFHHFDDILTACGVEKIKSIGDSYMVAGGLPSPQPDHAERCVDAAIKMMAYLDERNKTSSLKWLMRAGLHSGAVVAGVVGKNKFTYDVWGDTVNIASRMESAGEAGRINISAYTYDLVKHRFAGQYRGKLDAKGKGEVDMYFVDLKGT